MSSAEPKTPNNQDAGAPSKDNPQKRSALWFLSILLVSFVPGISFQSINGVGLTGAAPDIIRAGLWAAATYYALGFWFEWEANRTKRLEPLTTTRVGEELRIIMRSYEMGNSILELTESSTERINSITETINKFVDGHENVSENIEAFRVQIEHLARPALEQAINDIVSNGPILESEIATRATQEFASYLGSQFGDQRLVVRDQIQSISQQLMEVSANLRAVQDRLRALAGLPSDIKRLGRVVRRHVIWDSLIEDVWDFGGLFTFWALATAVFMAGTVFPRAVQWLSA